MNELKTRVFLRRDNEANYLADYVYGLGEVLFVDTDEGLKAKIGDGKTAFKDLQYFNDVIIYGYYLNNKFYTDSTYQVECVKGTNNIYIDKNTNGLFTWNGSSYNRDVAQATDASAGIMKLYDTHGQNIDGTMTQKSITDSLNTKFEVSVDENLETAVFTITL